MPITPSTRLGPYEILEPIGAGGMGEVWRALDTRLDRVVAIKILPSHLAQNLIFRERFEREARAISSLNHPHVCSLYDVGEEPSTDGSDPVRFLVMELIEGDSLADRLKRGPLPLSDVYELGFQIASALDTAHRQGIIHRDLKPGNIMLTRSGAKLLDFGLAKLSTAPTESIAGLTNLPTEAKALTQEGTILGTFQYMAPEQLDGVEADARTDIFALGAVLYEMAAGRRAFEGKTKTSLIAAIVDRDPPPVSSLQPMTPPALEHVIRKCLAKDPDSRWQSAADVASELRWIADAGSQAGVAGPVIVRRKFRERLGWALAVVFLLSTAAVIAWHLRQESMRRPAIPIRTAILPPEGMTFALSGSSIGSFALSPDGTKLVFSPTGTDRARSLWVRQLASRDAQPLIGTEGANFPFWSPDSRFVAFFVDGKLKKIDSSGGSPITICDAGEGRGGSWSNDGVITFAPQTQTGIHRVSASGGKPVEITKVNSNQGQTTHRYPFFLPDGKHFLYTAASHVVGASNEINSIWVCALGGEPKRLFQATSEAIYTQGHILFYRDGFLFAQPFDTDKLETVSDPFPVAEKVRFASDLFRAAFTASSNGLLAFQEGLEQQLNLTILDRKGGALGTIGEPGRFSYIRISPDGTQLAAAAIDKSSDTSELWVYDLARGNSTRLTFNKEEDDNPIWSPDGKQLAFRSARSGQGDIYLRSSLGGGADQLLAGTPDAEEPWDWSPDGKYISYNRGTGKNDLWILPLFGDKKPYPLVKSDADDGWGFFSPDGKWIAYLSNESGKWQMFATRFPSGEGKWQLSTDANWIIGWKSDGTEVYYLESIDVLKSVKLHTGDDLQVEETTTLFAIDSGHTWTHFRDGNRFIFRQSENKSIEAPVTLVVDWLSIQK